MQKCNQRIGLIERFSTRDRDAGGFGQPDSDLRQYGFYSRFASGVYPGIHRNAAWASDRAALKPDADSLPRPERRHGIVQARNADFHGLALLQLERTRVDARDDKPIAGVRILIEQAACQRVEQVRFDLVSDAAPAVG